MVVVANRPAYLACSALAIVCVGGAGYAITEGEGPITSLWWAVVTASTVGYGDFYPETTFGRAVATVLIVLMVTMIIPMITASFTSKLVVDRDAFTHEEQEDIKATLVAIADSLGLTDVPLRSHLSEFGEVGSPEVDEFR